MLDWSMALKVVGVGVAIGSASIGAYVTIKKDVAILQTDFTNLRGDVNDIGDDVEIILRIVREDQRDAKANDIALSGK